MENEKRKLASMLLSKKERAALEQFDMAVFCRSNECKQLTSFQDCVEIKDKLELFKGSFERAKDLYATVNWKDPNDVRSYGLGEIEFLEKQSASAGGVAREKSRTILATKMFGLNTPEQDLANLQDFERMSAKTQHNEALEQQKKVITKLCHFMNYLLVVNCQNQMSLKSEEELKNIAFIKDQSPWIEALTKKNKNLDAEFSKIKSKAQETAESSPFIVPGSKKELFATTSEQADCADQLERMLTMLKSGDCGDRENQRMVIDALSTTTGIVNYWKKEWGEQDHLLSLPHLDIQGKARDFAEFIHVQDALPAVDKVRASLYLSAVTRDVNHLLDTVALLSKTAQNDLSGVKLDPELTDIQLSKAVKFSQFNLLRDFLNLKTLFPQDFQIQSPGDELAIEIKYSGKAFHCGQDWQRYEQHQLVKAIGDVSFSIWQSPTYFVFLHQSDCVHKNISPGFKKDKDFMECIAGGKKMHFLITHMKDDGTQTLEFYQFERPNKISKDSQPLPKLKKIMEYIAAQRKGYTKSILFCNIDSNQPTANKYFLLKIKEKHMTVSTYCFGDGSDEPTSAVDVDLAISSDFDLDKFQLHDFKVAEKEDQFRLLFKLKDKKERESNENKNFALLILNLISGDIEGMKEFNIGGLPITQTDNPNIKDPANLHPRYDAWLDHTDECRIIECRDKNKSGGDRKQILLHHNVTLGSGGKRFFSRLENMEKASVEDDSDSVARNEFMYQTRILKLLRKPSQKQAEAFEDAVKRTESQAVSVNCLDGLYLVSKILSQHTKAYLEKLKEEDTKKRSAMLISSSFTVLQRAQTFTNLLKALKQIDAVGEQLLKQQREVWRFESDRPRAKKALYQIMEVLGEVFVDMRLVLAANLLALKLDGQISLQELLKEEQIDPSDFYKILFKLEIRHKDAIKSHERLKQYDIDAEQLLSLDFLIPFIQDELKLDDIFDFVQEQIMEHTAPMAVTMALVIISSLLKIKTEFKVDSLDKFVTNTSSQSKQEEHAEKTHVPQLGLNLKQKLFKLVTLLIPNLGKGNGQETKLRTWMSKTLREVLTLKKLSLAQRNFGQVSIIKLVMDSLSPDTDAKEQSEVIYKLLVDLKGMQPTKLNIVCIQAMVFTLYMRKELVTSQKMNSLIFEFIKQRTDLPESLLKDLLWLIGKQICQLIKSVQAEEEVSTGESSLSIIMQSDSLSGGIETHLLAHFNKEQLCMMEQEADIGQVNEVLTSINEAKEILDKGNLEDQFTDSDRMWRDVIFEGKNSNVDLACEGLLAKLTVGLAPINAARYEVGKETGMMLTRAAFAVMIKFSQLGEVFQSLVDSFEMETMTAVIPEAKGKERTKHLATIVETSQQSDKLVKLFANASNMRTWLSIKKKSLGELNEGKEDGDRLMQEELDSIYKKIQQKASFLVALQAPNGVYEVDEPSEVKMQKKSSYLLSRVSSGTEEQKALLQESIQTWQNNFYEFGILKNQQEMIQSVQQAGTASVLAILQAPISSDQIVQQIFFRARKAIRRISGFKLLESLLNVDANQEILIEIVAWFTSFQQESKLLVHYTEGVKGCGNFFEHVLQASYFAIVNKFEQKLSETEKHKIARCLVHSFDCKFLARDFSYLSQNIDIFNMFFRGGKRPKNLIQDCWSFYRPSKVQPLAKTVIETLQDVYLALIARISESNTIELLNIKNPAMSVTSLVRNKSTIDQNWSEQLITQVLDEIFRIFARVIQDKRALDQQKVAMHIKENWAKDLEDEPKGWDGNGDVPEQKLTKAQVIFDALQKQETDAALIGSEVDTKVKQEVADLYDKLTEKAYLEKFLSMIQVLANISQKAPIPQKTLQALASPEHLHLLLELLTITSTATQLKIVKVLESLVKNNLPKQIFDKGAKSMKLDTTTNTVLQMPDDFSQFAYQFAMSLRQKSPKLQDSDDNYAIIKQLLRLAFEFSALENFDQLDNAFAQIEKATKAEQSLLLEILGGSLTRFVRQDRVRYMDKAFKSIPQLLTNEAMIVVRTNSADFSSKDNRTTVTVWSRSEQKLIEVPHGQLEPMPLIESLSGKYTPKDDVVKHLIGLVVESPNSFSDLFKAQVMKFMIRSQDAVNKIDDQGLIKSLYDSLKIQGAKYQSIKNQIQEKISDQKISGPQWTFHKGFDMSGRGDVESIGSWKKKHSLESLKNYVMSKGYGGFALRYGHAYLKKLDGPINTSHLNPVSDCDFWILVPAGCDINIELFDTALVEEHLSNKLISRQYLNQPVDGNSKLIQKAEYQPQMTYEEISLATEDLYESVKLQALDKGSQKRSQVKNLFRRQKQSKQKYDAMTSGQKKAWISELREILADQKSPVMTIGIASLYALSGEKVGQQWLDIIWNKVTEISQVKEKLKLCTKAKSIKKYQDSAIKDICSLSGMITVKLYDVFHKIGDKEKIRAALKGYDKQKVQNFLSDIMTEFAFLSESSASDTLLWNNFEVTSQIDWAKFSRIPNKNTLLHKYYSSEDTRKQIDRVLAEGSDESGLGAQLLLSQLSLKLLIQIRKDEKAEVDEETLRLLMQSFQNSIVSEVTNYQAVCWQTQQASQEYLQETFKQFLAQSKDKAATFIGQTLAQSCFSLKFGMISGPQSIRKQIAEINFIDSLTPVILEDQQLLDQSLVKLFEFYLINIKRFAVNLDKSKNYQNQVLVTVRKQFATLHSLADKILLDPVHYAKIGNLEQITKMAIFKGYIKQIQPSCTSVRNLMDYLLLELAEKLQTSIDKARQASDSHSSLQNLQALSEIQDFRSLKANLRAKLVELQDSKPEKEEGESVKTLEICADPQPEEAQGWQKIDTQNFSGDKIEIHLPAVEGRENLRVLFAVSDEPMFKRFDPANGKFCQFGQVTAGKSTSIRWQGQSLYIKYPLTNEEYLLKVSNKGNQNKQAEQTRKIMVFNGFKIDELQAGSKADQEKELLAISRAQNCTFAITTSGDRKRGIKFVNQDIKTVVGPMKGYIYHNLCTRQGMKSNMQFKTSFDQTVFYTILTNQGRLYQYDSRGGKILEYPQIHSKLEKETIDRIAMSQYQLQLIDTKGQLFNIKPSCSFVDIRKTQEEKNIAVLVAQKHESDTPLRDGSHIVKFKNVWITESRENPDWPRDRISIYEVETSYGQTVLCSTGVCADNIGRVCNEKNPKTQIQMLDYEPEFTTFICVSVDAHAAVAVDQDGEIWVLAGEQRYGFNLNLPAVNKKEAPNSPKRKITRPIKTNFMRRLGVKATKVRVGSTMILVQTEDESGKKGLAVLKGENETIDCTREFKEMIAEEFENFEQNFDIVEMLPQTQNQVDGDIKAYFILKQKDLPELPPLSIKFPTKEQSKEKVEEAVPTEQQLKEIKDRIQQVHKILEAQIQKQGKDSIKRIYDNRCSLNKMMKNGLLPLMKAPKTKKSQQEIEQLEDVKEIDTEKKDLKWTEYKDFDASGKGDVKSISKWKEKHTWEDLQKMMIDNGWNAVALYGGTAFFKKFNHRVKKDFLNSKKDCDIWVYDPNPQDPKHYNESDPEVKKFIVKYMNTYQLTLDLIPLFSYIIEDPFLDDFKAGKQFLSDYQELCKLIRIELLQRAALSGILDKVPYQEVGQLRVTFNRIKATDFKDKNRYEKEYEKATMFSTLAAEYMNKFYHLKVRNKRPFTVRFTGEGAADCGGPMRDALTNVCDELMHTVLPLLIPTSNYISKVEPNPESYKLNPSATEPFVLKKYSFLGYFIGWSLRNICGLGIDIVPSFWRRLCGGPSYVYTMEDLHCMDHILYGGLNQIKEAAESYTAEDFLAVYQGYMFEDLFGGDEMEELCPGGKDKQLTKDNANEYIRLWLIKYTEKESPQFNQIQRGIEDVCGKRFLMHLTPKIAAKRALGPSSIEVADMKQVCGWSGDKEYEKKFWETVETLEYKDRALIIKFATGRNRLIRGERFSVSCHGSDDKRLPTAGTCGNSMSIQAYSTPEILRKMLLLAVRECGNIDADGGGGNFDNADDGPEGMIDDGQDLQGDQAVNFDSEDKALKRPKWDESKADPKNESGKVSLEDIGSDLEDDDQGDQEPVDYSINFMM